MNYSSGEIWAIIGLLAVGTFLIRFSFLGLIGERTMPGWVLKLLRYTSVAVLPGMVAPLILWPAANGGEVEPVRLAAAMATLVAGFVTKNFMVTVLIGVVTLIGGLWLTGQL